MEMAGSIIKKKYQSFFRSVENGDNSYSSKRPIFQGSKKFFTKNGSVLLEERVSLFHGKTNPILCLSANDLNTCFHDWVLYREDGFWKLYKCFWEGRPVLAKIFKNNLSENDISAIEQSCREIAVATQMGTHNNVHKLLACCLETQIPILIYEFVQNLHLGEVICTDNSLNIPLLEWKDRLRIAWEISHAVSYLHSAFPRPIIHRALKPRNVLLDQHNGAKLSDFSLCISIPEGKTEVEDEAKGTWFYADPEYVKTGTLTEKADVYALGVLFVVLLTGASPHIERVRFEEVKECLKHKRFSDFVDLVIIWNTVTVNEEIRQQLESCAEIVEKCIAEIAHSRPSMEEVTTQLKYIITSSEPSIPTTLTTSIN